MKGVWVNEGDVVDHGEGQNDVNESTAAPRRFDLSTEANATDTDGLPLDGEESDLSPAQAKLLTKFRALPVEMRRKLIEIVRDRGLDAVPAGLIDAACEKCAAESHSEESEEGEERPDADLLVVEVGAAPATVRKPMAGARGAVKPAPTAKII